MMPHQESVILQIDELTKKFGDLTAVDKLSLSVFKNEIFGFLGPNGAGKSTAINMICGLLPPTSGTISFDGNSKTEEYKTKIGYCSQENIFYPKLSCLEQMVFIGQMYGMKTSEAKKKSTELLEMLGLTGKINIAASKLSGGMKRRLNIGLSVIHSPEILVLDEPEAGLDPQSRILVRDFIKTYASEHTIIITTHNMDEADRLADRIAIIDYGKLLLLDTPENLKRTIGEGDVLEFGLAPEQNVTIETMIECLPEWKNSIKITGDSLIIQAKNMIGSLSGITEAIRQKGIVTTEIKLRENTLEDVFIQLTGRRLRQ